MTSPERVRKALKLEMPDRVPILEFLMDPKVAAKAVPGCKDVADAMDQLGMDGVGCGANFAVTQELGNNCFKDEWGVTYQRGPEMVAHPLVGPVETVEDIARFTPPAPEAPHRLTQLKEIVTRYKGKRAIVFHHRAAFMWSAYVWGMENLLTGFLLEPEASAVLLDKVLEANMKIVRNAIRLGAEVIVLGDDYAHNGGPMMSPAVFREFLKPRLAKMVDLIHAEGALCIKHSDGNLYSLLDDIVETGPDGLNPIEPVAGMELATVKSLYGDRICLSGNIDCGQLLPFGTREEVRQSVKKAIADAGIGGGFILSSSNSIHSSCNAANVVAMVKAGHEFGDYSKIGALHASIV
ncbi:MAG: hypothetical protein JNL74_10215 [Fibrobacteres bacterium]|nr:hypothetical protein [Fibrobacterota bacterium]